MLHNVFYYRVSCLNIIYIITYANTCYNIEVQYKNLSQGVQIQYAQQYYSDYHQ